MSTPFKKLDFDIDSTMDAVTAYSKENKVPSFVVPPASPPQPVAPVAAEQPAPKKVARLKRTEFHRVAFDLPTYLIDEISERAFKGKVTKRVILTKALKDAGFKVHDIDVDEDGRRER